MSYYHKKRFGQHFLRDTRIINRIISIIQPKPSQHLIEIGPGLGALTTQLLPLVRKMHAIEIDRDIIPKLQVMTQPLGELIIHNQDVLSFDFSTLKLDHLRIVGNLPYNISTPLLFHLFKYRSLIQDMHFMLQQEVAKRITAKVGEPDYGRLSILSQYYCERKLLFTVPPEAFFPKPKVHSAFIQLIPHKKPPLVANNVETLSTIVKYAFMKRRKTLRNALKGIVSIEKLEALSIDLNARPQDISLEDYIKIADDIDHTKMTRERHVYTSD